MFFEQFSKRSSFGQMVQGFVAAVVAAVAVFCDCCSPGGSIHVLFVLPPKLAKLPRATFWAHGQES